MGAGTRRPGRPARLTARAQGDGGGRGQARDERADRWTPAPALEALGPPTSSRDRPRARLCTPLPARSTPRPRNAGSRPGDALEP